MDTALSQPVGQLLGGRYHVGSRIARGGMATVYLGTDTRLDRVIALKIAHPELSDDAEFVRRFIGEARSAARLSSPNVVGIFDQGSDKRLHYIAMEYVPGRTLRQLLNERGRLSPREALDIMSGVLAGLAAAHEAGFAHRDVKPENVLLTPAGGVKVADFGLARAVAGAVQTKGGMIIGTAAYLAPEQVSGGTSDARTDVYAAGVMLYELLTGVQPHTAESPLAVAYKHVNEVVPAPSSILPGMPGPVDALVAMATSRDPDLRPANAEQFLRAVKDVQDRLWQGSAPYPAPGPSRATGPGSGAGHFGAPVPGAGSLPGPAGYAPAAGLPPGHYPGSGPYPQPASWPGSEPYPGQAPGTGLDSQPGQAGNSGPMAYSGPVSYSGPVPYPDPYPGSAPYADSAPYSHSAPYPDPAYPDPAYSDAAYSDAVYSDAGYSDSAPYPVEASRSGSRPYQDPGPYPGPGSRSAAGPYHSADPHSDSASYSTPIPGRSDQYSTPVPGRSDQYSTPIPGRSDQFSMPPSSPDGDSGSGPVGASALPSLRPQSEAVGQVQLHADAPSQVNHTLIVSETGLLSPYDDDPGRGGRRGGLARDGSRRLAHPRLEPRLQSYLFSRKLGYVAAGVAVVVLAGFIAWWLSSGRYQTVPALRSVSLSAARAELKNLGLNATVGKPVTNPVVPKGEVVSTLPHQGSRVAGGGTVKLIVSLGPVMLPVPNVSGQPLASAQAALTAAHLKPGAVKQAVSSTVPAGDVISTKPAAMSQCPRNQPVVLIVSAGPGLPNFVGMLVPDAQAQAAGQYTINPIADKNGSQPANTIVRQSPEPNTPITPGEVVTVYYSPGPPAVPVPDVQGMSVTQATLILHRAGFQVAINSSGPGDKVGSYSPTTPQPKGSTITLNIGFFNGGF